MAVSSSEEEELLLISISSFACIKNENTVSFKRFAVVTVLTFGVSDLLHVHFHRKFWLITVR